MESTS
jgi:hypothetical protein